MGYAVCELGRHRRLAPINSGQVHADEYSGGDDLAARERFLSRVTKLHQQGQFTPGVNLDEFLTFFRQSGVADHLLIDGFLHVKKEQLRDGRTNPINYVAETAKAALEDDGRGLITGRLNFASDRFARGLGEVTANLLAMAAEYPLAQVSKRERRRYFWENDGGNWRLRGDFGYIDEILQEAQLSSQALPFELPRYRVNEANYRKLRAQRSALLSGDADTQRGDVFVEFSPSPPLTPDAKRRGYLGNDCIFFFTFDPVYGAEIQEQRWFKADKRETTQLISRLTGEEITETSDITLMAASGFYESHQVREIHAFIDAHHGRAVAHPRLTRYVEGELREYLRRELTPILTRAAKKLIRGEGVTFELMAIETTLAFAQQVLLAEKVGEVTGLAVTRWVTGSAQRARLMYDTRTRMEFVEKNNVPLAGCGGSKSLEDSLFGKALSLTSDPIEKSQSSLRTPDYKNDPNLCRCGGREPHFHCPGKVRNQEGKLIVCNCIIAVGKGITNCPRCGKGRVC